MKKIKLNNACNSRAALLFIAVFLFFSFFYCSGAIAETATIGATVPAICGNGTKEGTEECDDGNLTNADGCSSLCTTETGSGPLPPNPPPACVPNGSCSAAVPACGQTTSGVDNCGNACSKTGEACQCVPIQGSCSAPAPTCAETTTSGKDNCGNDCARIIPACECVSNGSCSAPSPACGQTTYGVDNCEKACSKTGAVCQCAANPFSCNAPYPACGQTTEGKDNCGNVCVKSGPVCDQPINPPPGNGGQQNSGSGGQGAGSGSGNIPIEAEKTEPIIEPVVVAVKEAIINPILSELKIISEIKEIKVVTEAVKKNVKSAVRKISAGGKTAVREIIKIAEQAVVLSDNPRVENVVKSIGAPTTIAVSVAVAAPSLWSIVLPLARFLFLQPILVLGMKKRKEWGEVYNSLTKLPVDLATVKLIDIKNNKIIRSRVTDAKGRYLLSAPEGMYKIEVIKNMFTFPSDFLSGVLTDGARVDIYHGENLIIKEKNSIISANIPLDPSDAEKTPRRIYWQKRLRFLQHFVSILGIILTALYAYIAPEWYVFVFLAVHLSMYGVFYFFANPRRPKGWGIVHESVKKSPVGNAIARLFSKQYNKLVATEITDSRGRYAFLAGPNDYFVTVEKKGYDQSSKDITVHEGEPHIVKENFVLEKKD